MAFHEVQFPTGISYGSRGGPGHRTTVIELDSGAEQRINPWTGARRHFNAKYGIKTFDQLYDVMEFLITREGATHSFRYKDELDFSTGTKGRGTPAFGNVIIGTGNNTVGQQFQLIKRYQSSAGSKVRNLVKPVAGTTKSGFNGVEKTVGVDWSVDTTTGIITYTTAVPSGQSVTAGTEFDTPVRFGGGVDQVLAVSLDNFNNGIIPDIDLIEDIDPAIQQEDFYYGRADAIVSAVAVQVTPLTGAAILVNMTAASQSVYLPAASGFADGGPHMWLFNNGANAWALKTGTTTIVASVGAGTAVALFSVKISGAYTWKAFGP